MLNLGGERQADRALPPFEEVGEPARTDAHRARRFLPRALGRPARGRAGFPPRGRAPPFRAPGFETDRKSTRLNSSHMSISYAVFCLKKKKTNTILLKLTADDI